jgi:hypothetical protein
MNAEQQKLERYTNLLNKEPLRNQIIPSSLYMKFDNVIKGTKEIARFKIFHALKTNGQPIEWSRSI